jgi:hypothetical protein
MELKFLPILWRTLLRVDLGTFGNPASENIVLLVFPGLATKERRIRRMFRSVCSFDDPASDLFFLGEGSAKYLVNVLG